MIYNSSDAWLSTPHKKALLFAMSGLGKTHTSNMLRCDGGWFHYSVDYRISTRYMGEYIADNLKKIAMKDPFLAELLKSDSISIAPNTTFDNLGSLSAYLGKPGNTSLGGIEINEYQKRQNQHHHAEILALLDTPKFIKKAQNIYGYNNFICDTGGSIVEVVDAANPDDPVMKCLSQETLMIWIKGSTSHTQELIKRFDKSPKPICYSPDFLAKSWNDYQLETGLAPDKVNPNDFIRWIYAKVISHREPRYQAMAKWGITVSADEISQAPTPALFETLIATKLDTI